MQRGLFLTLFGFGTLVQTPVSVAAAPKGHFVIDNDTVNDTATKLTWQRTAPDKSFSGADAEAYCSGLKLDGSGWRLPTIKELHTLVDETRTTPAIDVDAFPDTASSFFWTSSRLAKFPQYTWSVNFADGGDAWFPAENPQHVRCVR
jgi:Protein of unknown function (DUF1566)